MILQIQQGLREDGYSVPMTKLCRWFEVPRRTVYYRPVKSAPKVQERFAAPIKQLIEADPSFGYRTVAGLLQFNKNTVQRIFQIKGWQVRKRAVGHRPRIEALPSVATTPNERWATDLCRVWAGRDGWQTLALVIDCHTRELLGWQLSRSGRATTAMSALEQALIGRFGTLGRVTTPFLLRSDNGLVFTSHPHPEGAVRTPSSLRDPATRLARHRRVDPLLQHPSAPPGPRHENPSYGVCFNGLTCAESGGVITDTQSSPRR
jgi:putative transposase